MTLSTPQLFEIFRRFAYALVAVVCLTSGLYTLKASEPTPPALVMLAAETEAAHHIDQASVQQTVMRKRAGDPLRSTRAIEQRCQATHRPPQPRGPPAPHVEPRGPPVVA